MWGDAERIQKKKKKKRCIERKRGLLTIEKGKRRG